MSLHARTGLVTDFDFKINNIQQALYVKFLADYNLPDDNKSYECYARIYKSKDIGHGGYKPLAYVAKGDYKEVLFDDSLAALSFFHKESGEISEDTDSKAKVQLIFFVNLTKLVADSTDEVNDELVRGNLKDWLNKRFGFVMSKEVLWQDNVLSEFKGWRSDNLKKVDTYPWHCFRLDLYITYIGGECNIPIVNSFK